MKINFIKKINKFHLVTFSAIAISLFYFLMPTVSFAAGDFGDMVITAKIKYENAEAIPLKGVVVTVTDGGSGNSYSGRCGSGNRGTRKCSTAGMVDLSTSPDTCLSNISKKTNDEGKVSWSNTFSSCSCTYKIDLSAPAIPDSNYVYDGGWSPTEPFITGSFGNDNTFSKTFTIKAKKKETCNPDSETRSVSCPVGQTGSITQQRDYTCPAKTWGNWYEVSNTCKILGCTDSAADNYNPAAQVDDGSCTYTYCNASISASTNNFYLDPGSTTNVALTGSAVGAVHSVPKNITVFTWFRNGAYLGTGQTYNYSVSTPGSSEIEMLATDIYGWGCSSTLTIKAYQLSCNIAPASGNKPLTVRVEDKSYVLDRTHNIFHAYESPTPSGTPVDFTTLFYTFSNAGLKSITLTNPDYPGKTAICGTNIQVNEPVGPGSGGETR